jgi:hypothetical protein
MLTHGWPPYSFLFVYVISLVFHRGIKIDDYFCAMEIKLIITLAPWN